MDYAEVLDYWFRPEMRRAWFEPSGAVDEEIRRKFGDELTKSDSAAPAWGENPRAQLALVILWDQFPRHIYRGTPRAFAFDARALARARRICNAGQDTTLDYFERAFLYLPFEHAEDLKIQIESVERYRSLAAQVPAELREYFLDNLRYAERHHEIIARFGRFPHRNAVLGRASTPDEISFLTEPMSSF